LAVLLFILSSVLRVSGAQKIWKIGERDGESRGLAMAPDRYGDFNRNDFGWEDRFFLVGYSDPGKSFPYILPSSEDAWAGSTYLAGPHTYVVNILFDVSDKGRRGDWTLDVDFCDTHSRKPPLFKVTVNGEVFKYALPAGGGDGSLVGDFSSSRPYHLSIPIDGELINCGNNEVSLTSVEGSWVIFDSVSMSAPDGASIRTDHCGAYVRDVRPADFLLEDGSRVLIVSAEHLDGKPELSLRLDGNDVWSRKLEKGSYCLEIPVPASIKKKKSRFELLVDGNVVRKGRIQWIQSGRTVRPVDYVNTGMGTSHSRWMLAPGPWMPFSMVKLSPDNEPERWQGGYDNMYESVGTFSHIHEWTMAGLGTMPVCGPLKTKIGDPGELKGHADGYRSYIDKKSEICEAGYYSVLLTDYNIKAELTSTERCSFQRYTYPSKVTPRVMVDFRIPAEYGYEIVKCEVRRTGPRRLEGFSAQQTNNVWSNDADQYYTINFVMEFDRDVVSMGGWNSESAWDGDSASAEHPSGFGCWVEFAPESGANELNVRTGISFVDIDGASNNLSEEVEKPFGWSFDEAVKANKDTWNGLLSRIAVKSDDRNEKIRFYSNLYRSFCRNTFSDVDGRWMKPDGSVGKVSGDTRVMGCDAFWNSFWNLNQVWNLVAPEWSSKWVRSQLAMYDASGFLAKGPAGAKYIPVMVAEHEIPLMVSAYQMGIRDYDADKAFEAMVKMQTVPSQKVGRGYAGNRDLESYLQYHYVPADLGRFSNTLEYSYDDWTVSMMAESLGRKEEAAVFGDRGTWWKNVIDQETGYARLRYSDGRWARHFDPFRSGANHHYVEGNAWQLTFFVPQDVRGLADIAGRHRLVRRLEWGFGESSKYRYNAPGESYWDFPVVQGNQQSMHFAYLFNWLGKPWETQEWSRSIMEKYYGCGRANAWLGDEDQGQMSAWLVMASLGLFQTDGGCSTDPKYEIASPSFPEVKIDLGRRYGRGDSLIIRAEGASRDNIYVQSAEFNGKPVDSFLIDAADLLAGGELVLVMGDKPNRGWGVRHDDGSMENGSQWNDTDGSRINAHGGGILFHEGTYYWYGECKSDSTYWNPNVPGWECYRTEAGGVNCYSSKDLLNWKYEGVVLKPEMNDRRSDIHWSKVIERPKVVYNEKTGKFVMWMHIDSDTYGYAAAGVAACDSPTGEFRYLGSVRPNHSDSRDMTLFKDDDGKAYLISSAAGNSTLYFSLLSDDYLSHTGTFVKVFPGRYREAPAICKRKGKYYMITSGCTGWSPNQAEYAVADSILGPWTAMGNPCTGPDADKTFYGQSTFILPVQGQDDMFVAMFDEWNKTDLINSTYLWMPVVFDDGNGTISVPWKDEWTRP